MNKLRARCPRCRVAPVNVLLVQLASVAQPQAPVSSGQLTVPGGLPRAIDTCMFEIFILLVVAVPLAIVIDREDPNGPALKMNAKPLLPKATVVSK